MATAKIPQRKDATWTPKSARVEFHLIGTGNVSLQSGMNAQGQTVWFDHKKAALFGKPESLIVKYANGSPIQGGRIRWPNGGRLISFKRDETAIIEALYHAPECANGPYANHFLAKYRMVDVDAEKVTEYEQYKKERDAMVLYANIGQDSIKDLAVILGYNEDDFMNSEMALGKYAKQFPDQFANFFKEYTDGERPVLKEELKVQAILKRATQKGIVQNKVGAYYYNDQMIGSDLENAVRNLMNNDAGSPNSFAYVLPLLGEAMKKK